MAAEDTMSIEELRREVRRSWDREFALVAALRDLPEVPPVKVLDVLSAAATFPSDWDLGKVLQRRHGLDAVPPRTEYENGAGLWSRIRQGLIGVDIKSTTEGT